MYLKLYHCMLAFLNQRNPQKWKTISEGMHVGHPDFCISLKCPGAGHELKPNRKKVSIPVQPGEGGFPDRMQVPEPECRVHCAVRLWRREGQVLEQRHSEERRAQAWARCDGAVDLGFGLLHPQKHPRRYCSQRDSLSAGKHKKNKGKIEPGS